MTKQYSKSTVTGSSISYLYNNINLPIGSTTYTMELIDDKIYCCWLLEDGRRRVGFLLNGYTA